MEFLGLNVDSIDPSVSLPESEVESIMKFIRRGYQQKPHFVA